MTLTDQIRLSEDMIAENPETTLKEFLRLVRHLDVVAVLAEIPIVKQPSIRRVEYIYQGRLGCAAVRDKGKCILDDHGGMLVDFGDHQRVVQANMLKKLKRFDWFNPVRNLATKL